MKIAVTTIAKNEEAHAERWVESARDADCLFVCDTGSSDNTVECLRDSGVEVKEIDINPWRFDYARNLALTLTPPVDYVITLDMDEVLLPGWREALESAPEADQYTYDYQWSDEVFFRGNRCFRRNGFYWKHPVHEVVAPIYSNLTTTVEYGGFSIVHLPDASKPRSQYLPLLALGVKESPDDDRLAHYYGRELYFTGDWDKAREELVRHIEISKWPAERAQSYRYLAKMDSFPERWLLRAIAESPDRREPWIDLIHLYKSHGLPVDSLVARALTIQERPVDYMSEATAWDDTYVKGLGSI
jgi:glycosyltransferase involved in cell wall biosynthesis